MILDFVGLLLLISGFVVGLGAVTVIDIHGFLGRKSNYWTEATTRTHKVTKPLIWLGIFTALSGGVLFFRNESLVGIPFILSVISIILIVNGIFLSFWVSPYLLKREKAGRQSELLPASWQRKIIVSLIFSDLGWWGGLILLVYYLLTK